VGHQLHFIRRAGVRREGFGPRFVAPRSGFGPADVLALSPAAWYRRGVGVTTATGVSAWADQSGNGRTLSQATGSAQPTLNADGSILFDGAAQFMRTASFTINQPGTVYWLMRQITWTASEKLFDGFTPGGRWLIQQRAAGASPQLEIFAGTSAGNVSLTLGTYGVIAAVYNGASSLVQLNSAAPATIDAGANNFTGGLTLCADNAAIPTVFGNFEVKEGLFFASAHDAATRAKVIGYLAGVGGVSV
jgi:hypothetical protein